MDDVNVAGQLNNGGHGADIEGDMETHASIFIMPKWFYNQLSFKNIPLRGVRISYF